MTVLILVYLISVVASFVAMTIVGILTSSDELMEYDMCLIPLVNSILIFVFLFIIICTITLIMLGEEV